MHSKSFDWRYALLIACACLLFGQARADVEIEIVGVGSQQYPIAIAPFQSEVALLQPLTPVITNDLNLSGLFKTIGIGGLSPVPYSPAELNHGVVAGLGARTALLGRVEPLGAEVKIQVWLIEVTTGNELISFSVKVPATQLRRAAHKIADMVYEKLVGEKGAFSSRIAYVIQQGSRYELQVADSDGYGAQSILSSREPILTPKWSPDGESLAYVSFERQKAVVFTHHLRTGARVAVANFPGNNSAPAWSPDGKQLAVALTKEGGTQVFLMSATGGPARRFTTVGAINTEPAWTPDGRALVYTSDRGGTPQIYRQALVSADAERLTYEGAYNASAKFSSDGKQMIFVTKNDTGYHVAVMDMATRQSMVLTQSPDDDSPSFSPNGRMILYEMLVDRHRTLAVVSSDGRVKQRIKALAGDVRQPAWGPLLN